MAFQTIIRSAFMRRMTSERTEVRAIKKGRKQRDKRGRPVVHYFHGVADPFSALAVQTLTTLVDAYNVDIRCHIA
ncbi:MAG: 2-hydroxychromene-2-carboxylate isomerase, partial [Gammaproteobacteria bacterium]